MCSFNIEAGHKWAQPAWSILLSFGARGWGYLTPGTCSNLYIPLIELQPIVGVLIEDIDDFAVTIPMRKMAIGHLSKIASALPGMSLIISQTLSRWDRDHSIRHNDIDGAQRRYEFYLRSFSGLSQFIDHFQCTTASLGLHDVSNLELTRLYEITGGNLASTMQHLCHPLLKHKWK